MIPVLRPYQVDLIEQTRAACMEGCREVLTVLPTGGGKAVLGAYMMAAAAAKGGGSVFLADRTELVDQASSKLDDAGLDHGVIQADHWRRRPHLPVQVASVPTLHRRGIEHLNPRLVIADEAHKSLAPTYLEILKGFIAKGATVIGMTATPYLLNGDGLGTFYKKLVVGVQMPDLIAQGFLVPIDVIAPQEPSLADVRVTRGEYKASDLERVMGDATIVGDVVETWQREARGRTTACFAVSKRHARELMELFRAAGISTDYLDDETPGKERAAVLSRVASGETLIVVNVGILTIGWDMPRVSCVSLVRPTLSRSLYRQMVGRGSRPHCPSCKGFDRTCLDLRHKKNLVVLDHAGNVFRHGLPDSPEDFYLEAAPKRSRFDRVPGLRYCPACRMVCPAGTASCTRCHEPFPAYERTLVFRDGQLAPVARGEQHEQEPRAPRVASDDEKVRMLARWTAEAGLKGYKPGYPFARFVGFYGDRPTSEQQAEARDMRFPRFLVARGCCRHCESKDLSVSRNMPLEGGSVICRACGRGLAWAGPEWAPVLQETA